MWRDDAYLLDMFIGVQRVLEFRAALTWEQFRQSGLHQHAIAMRHRIAHDYFRLDLLRVREIAVHDVPALISAIEPHVPPEHP